MMRLRARSGFTLIELIIYIGLSTIVLVALARVMLTITASRERLETVSIVQQEGRYVMHRLTTTVQDAVSINLGASTLEDDNGVLSLEMADAARNPTTITRSAGGVFLQEGTSAPRALTSADVIVEHVRFIDRTAPDTNGTVSMSIRLTDNRAGEDAAYQDDITLTTSVSLRP